MELLKVNEFANRFNLSISKVRAMCQTGELPACKIGVGWRIDVEKAEQVLSILFDRKTSQKRNFSTTRAYKPRRDFDFKSELARLRGKAV